MARAHAPRSTRLSGYRPTLPGDTQNKCGQALAMIAFTDAAAGGGDRLELETKNDP
jgi:hypothetical protein